MKKILSVFAFVAMLCIPFSLVSCGDDDDSVTSTPSTKSETYTINIQRVGGSTTTIDKVLDLVKSKLGKYVGNIEKQVTGDITMTITNPTAVDDILKDFGSKYKNDLDKLMKDDEVKIFHVTVSYKLVTKCEYDYEKEGWATGFPISAGTYTYTDDNGAVWSFTLTDQVVDADNKIGSMVIPTDTLGVKAGTYDGTYHIVGTGTVTFNSNQKEGNNSVASFNAGFFAGDKDTGIPVAFFANKNTIFRATMFQKK